MTSIQISRSMDFVQSIGVNIHLGYVDSPLWANVPLMISSLNYMGVNHVRDGLPSGSGSSEAPYTKMMAQGFKFDLIANASPYEPTSMFSVINALAKGSAGGISAVEGFNEINNWPVTYGNLRGNQAAESGQQSIYSMVKGDPLLAGVPVYDLTGAADVQPSVDQSLISTLNGRADLQNIHVYPQNGDQPSGWISHNQSWFYNFNAPAVITEFGYYTLSDSSGMSPQQSGYWGGVDQTTQGKLIINGLLDAWSHGYKETYIYDLFDAYKTTSPENYFGLFNFDGTPKPAAIYIHNITSIVADVGMNASSFTTSQNAFSVSGLPSTGNDLLLENADGNYFLVLWNEPTTSNSINTVTVSLGATYGMVKVFDPTTGTTAIQTLSNTNSIAVTLSDHPLIIESITSPPSLPASATDTLQLSLSEDAWQGDAQAIITIDGKTTGAMVTVTALHNQGKTQSVTLSGQWGPGVHDVGVQFINDAYGGSSTTDRNLYVDGVSFDGQASAIPPSALYSNGTAHLATAASPLVLQLSEDAYLGDAQFSVAVDGKVLGPAQSVVALHANGAAQNFGFGQAIAAGTHDVAVSFLNDAWGGTAATDRNLYVSAIDVNGGAIAGTSASLMTTSTHHFSVVVAAPA